MVAWRASVCHAPEDGFLSLQNAPQPLTGLGEVSLHGTFPDTEDLRDSRLGEILEVPKNQAGPLARPKLVQCAHQLVCWLRERRPPGG